MDTNTFALIAPDGTLTFEEGVPDQAWAKVDPHSNAEGFTVAHASSGEPGLRAYVGGISALKPDEYPYNQVGSGLAIVLAASYGGRLQVDVYGHLAVCGYEMDSDGDVDVAGLTLLQQDLVTTAHAEVLRRLGAGADGEGAR
uniref:hypothetical protein n=1 Tax=Promicromonospora sp. CA-289581 TaxID=3240013 RepID=UPI003F497D09